MDSFRWVLKRKCIAIPGNLLNCKALKLSILPSPSVFSVSLLSLASHHPPALLPLLSSLSAVLAHPDTQLTVYSEGGPLAFLLCLLSPKFHAQLHFKLWRHKPHVVNVSVRAHTSANVMRGKSVFPSAPSSFLHWQWCYTWVKDTMIWSLIHQV